MSDLDDLSWSPSGPFWRRTARRQAFSVAEGFTDGLGGNPTLLRGAGRPLAGSSGKAFHFAKFDIFPAIGIGINYSHIETPGSPTIRESLFAVNPSFIARLGDLAQGRIIALEYRASIGVVADSDSTRQQIDQQFTLDARYSFTKLELGFGTEFASLSGQDRDAGRQIDRQFLTLALTSRYLISPKTSLSWDITFPSRKFTGGVSSTGVTSSQHVDYQLSPRTTLGAGFVIGRLDLDHGSAQTFQQPNIRFSYELTEKMRANLALGYEFRQVGNASVGTPVFAASASWTPRKGTTLELSSERRTFNSGTIDDVNYNSTTALLTLTQRLGSRKSAVFGIGYEHSSYEAFGSAAGTSRLDDLLFVQAALNVMLGRRLNCALTTTWNDNESDVQPYRSIYIGFQTTLDF